MNSIKKAVIPAAGKGTRLLPVTRCIPKELLPVGKQPMIQFALDEAVSAGVEEILIVVNRGQKQLIQQYYSGTNLPATRIRFVCQEQPLGLVDALERARKHLDEEPFFLLLPDNVFFAQVSSSVQLLACFQEYKQSVLGLIEVAKEEARYFGNCGKVEGQRLKDRVYELTKLYDKRAGTLTLEDSERTIRSCGRYILGREFWQEVQRTSRPGRGELDDVPILQEMIAKRQMKGVLLQGKLFDCGHWEGYWAANKYFMEHRAQWS